MRRPVWIIAAAIVVAAAVVAVVVGRGGGAKKKPVDSATAPHAETRPVVVAGTPLPALAPGADPAVGTVPPELHGQTFDGKPVDITNDGEPKIILMVAHWCPHCQKEVPLLAAYLQANGMPAGVRLVTIATNTKSTLPNYPPSAWLAKVGWPTPVMADDSKADAAVAYGLSAFPFFMIVDAHNHVAGRVSGELTTAQFAKLAALAKKT